MDCHIDIVDIDERDDTTLDLNCLSYYPQRDDMPYAIFLGGAVGMCMGAIGISWQNTQNNSLIDNLSHGATMGSLGSLGSFILDCSNEQWRTYVPMIFDPVRASCHILASISSAILVYNIKTFLRASGVSEADANMFAPAITTSGLLMTKTALKFGPKIVGYLAKNCMGFFSKRPVAKFGVAALGWQRKRGMAMR